MKKMTLNSVQKNNVTPVSNLFLDCYMNDANGEFVKVYLYLLRCMSGTCPDVSLSEIADTLNLTEKDVVRALKYWAKVNVLAVEYDSEHHDPSSITFLPLEDVTPVPEVSPKSAPVREKTTRVSEEAVLQTREAEPELVRHNLSPADIKRMKEREDIKQLLYIVERYIGKPLTGNEVNIVLYMHDTLDYATELIEYLVEYCVTNNHISLRYMEKVAMAWHDKGIRCVADARSAAAIRSQRTLVVSKTFGISDRNITPVEMDFITRWYDEYGFDKEIVAEACKKTIMTMGKPNFSYADGILKKWKNADVHTLSDLKTFDAGFRAKITVPVTANVQAPAKSTNKFNDFSQRTYDFDEMERNLINNK